MQVQQRGTINVDEAAARLGIHPQSLYKAIRKGQSPVPVIRIQKRLLVPSAAIDRLLSDGESA